LLSVHLTRRCKSECCWAVCRVLKLTL
jgi:hypothetical protein